MCKAKLPVNAVELFRDGINADRAATDYKREVLPVPADRKLQVKLAPGGGYAVRIYADK